MTTRLELLHVLFALDDAGAPTPCLDAPRPARDQWTANDAETQALAATACAWCTGHPTCAAYIAEHPKEFGVYAGTTDRSRARDRTRRENGEPR